jgi:exopolysaccharide biosynthesis polyprenyl glycosylphosphotransferase
MNSRKGTASIVPRFLVLLTDCTLMVAGYCLAYIIRFRWPLPIENLTALETMIPWIAVMTAIIFGSMGLYGTPPFDNNNTSASVLVGVLLSELATMAGAYWFRSFAVPRTVFAIALPVHAAILIAWRHALASYEGQGESELRYVAVSGEGALQVAEALGRGCIVATVSPKEDASSIDSAIRDVQFDAVLVDSATLNANKGVFQHLVTKGKQVVIVPGPEDIVMASARAGQIDDQPVLLISPLGLSPGQSFNKRTVDMVVSAASLFVLSPLMLAVALAIALASGFPVFYAQDRVGMHSRAFRIWKFRTMKQGAEDETGPTLSIRNDPRVTAVGRLLRAVRVDEIPQLWNVLRGDMSMVGPRPERPEFVGEFERSIPSYAYRHLVKPGLTGLAQVKGKYDTRPQEKLLFDLTYIANYSMRLDLMILLRTAAVLLTPSRASGVRVTSGDRPR